MGENNQFAPSDSLIIGGTGSSITNGSRSLIIQTTNGSVSGSIDSVVFASNNSSINQAGGCFMLGGSSNTLTGATGIFMIAASGSSAINGSRSLIIQTTNGSVSGSIDSGIFASNSSSINRAGGCFMLGGSSNTLTGATGIFMIASTGVSGSTGNNRVLIGASSVNITEAPDNGALIGNLRTLNNICESVFFALASTGGENYVTLGIGPYRARHIFLNDTTTLGGFFPFRIGLPTGGQGAMTGQRMTVYARGNLGGSSDVFLNYATGGAFAGLAGGDLANPPLRLFDAGTSGQLELLYNGSKWGVWYV
jgi:hypothetical protein